MAPNTAATLCCLTYLVAPQARPPAVVNAFCSGLSHCRSLPLLLHPFALCSHSSACLLLLVAFHNGPVPPSLEDAAAACSQLFSTWIL
eukprot:TRINITY_DN7689_c0_g1_i1.p5 TRINITY_DN7689_c0_g1~~TRINITY_DN7689_c0_g1_i1.p5  ORF type:complete len:88 (-),score=18.70 TRINITY_DN7689_c0_g1_i1:727-990(-)